MYTHAHTLHRRAPVCASDIYQTHRTRSWRPPGGCIRSNVISERCGCTGAVILARDAWNRFSLPSHPRPTSSSFILAFVRARLSRGTPQGGDPRRWFRPCSPNILKSLLGHALVAHSLPPPRPCFSPLPREWFVLGPF